MKVKGFATFNKEFKERFRTNLRNLCDIYKHDKDNGAKNYAQIYRKIEEYYNDKGIECFSNISFRKWISGASVPDSYNIYLLCEFFDCDANYLFGTDYIDPENESNQLISKTDKYIFSTYGLDRKTLEFFKKYKDSGIDSVDDNNAPHTASSTSLSFSSLFNALIHQSPWVINALLQIINAERLNLSSYGFADIDNTIKSYPDFPGISGHLLQEFDENIAISVLAIRLKALLANPDYTPNTTNNIETYDPELLKPGAVDEYISELLSTRLKKLNDEIATLTDIATSVMCTNQKP